MATFSQCPRCNCKDEGTEIYQCLGCKTIFCDVCGTGSGGCSCCGSDGTALGEVQNEKDDE